MVINQPGNIRITVAGGSAVANSIAITGDTLEVTGGTLAVTGAVNNSGSIIVDAAAQISASGAYTGRGWFDAVASGRRADDGSDVQSACQFRVLNRR